MTMQQNQQIETVITKHLMGETSPEEIMALTDWLKEDQRHEELYRQIKAYWEAEVTADLGIDYPSLLGRTLDRIRREERKRGPNIIMNFVKIGIVAALFIGVLFYLGHFTKSSDLDACSYNSGDIHSSIVLPDGTEVLLNRYSTITQKSSFGEKERRVSLSGEAYFKVVSVPDKPFVVDLGETRIKVLGTSFNVRNRDDDEVLSAVLIEGSIQFESFHQQVVIKPNQMVLYNKSEQLLEIKQADVQTAVAWKNNLIRYESLSFEQVTKLLEENYHVKVRVEDELLRNERLSGSFDSTLSLEQLLDIMKKNIGFNWAFEKENTYVITK